MTIECPLVVSCGYSGEMLNVKSFVIKCLFGFFLHRFAPEKLVVQGGVPGFWLESSRSLGSPGRSECF